MPGLPGSPALGRFIARARDDLNLTQKQLGAQLGWSVGTQRRIEKGTRALKSEGDIVAVARALKITEESLRTAAVEKARLPARVSGADEQEFGAASIAATLAALSLDELVAARGFISRLVELRQPDPPDRHGAPARTDQVAGGSE